MHHTCQRVSYLCEGQLGDGGQGQVGVQQRDTVGHTHRVSRRAGRQQQPVDAAAREQTAVQVHLHISPTGQLHLAHDDHWQDTDTKTTDSRLHHTSAEANCTPSTHVNHNNDFLNTEESAAIAFSIQSNTKPGEIILTVVF